MQKNNIEFYILEDASAIKAWQYACTLIEKHYQEYKCTYVHTDSQKEAERFDNLLWTFREDSFIPHEICKPNASEKAPVEIGFPGNKREASDLLINLSNELPANYEVHTHIIEIVFKDEARQQFARERFKQYRDSGHSIQTHKMKSI